MSYTIPSKPFAGPCAPTPLLFRAFGTQVSANFCLVSIVVCWLLTIADSQGRRQEPRGLFDDHMVRCQHINCELWLFVYYLLIHYEWELTQDFYNHIVYAQPNTYYELDRVPADSCCWSVVHCPRNMSDI